jgi:hypothetical protein
VHHNYLAHRRPTPAALMADRRPAHNAVDDTPTEPQYVIPPTSRSPRPPQPDRQPDPDDAGGRHRRHRGTTRRTDTELARNVAGLASLAAGVIHVGATPGHWAEWPAAGLFFAGTAAFQILWSVLVVAVGGRFLAVIGILGSLGVLGAWAVSRRWGVPFGPHADVPEAVGLADTLATLLAGVVTAVMLWSLLPRERNGVLSAGGYRLATIGALLVMATAAVTGTVDALGPGHSHSGAGGDAPHDDGTHDDDTGTAPRTGDAEPDGVEPDGPEPAPPTHDDGHDHTH